MWPAPNSSRRQLRSDWCSRPHTALAPPRAIMLSRTCVIPYYRPYPCSLVWADYVHIWGTLQFYTKYLQFYTILYKVPTILYKVQFYTKYLQFYTKYHYITILFISPYVLHWLQHPQMYTVHTGCSICRCIQYISSGTPVCSITPVYSIRRCIQINFTLDPPNKSNRFLSWMFTCGCSHGIPPKFNSTGCSPPINVDLVCPPHEFGWFGLPVLF